MPSYKITSVDPVTPEPFTISATLRRQLNYFVITKSAEDEQRLAANEFEVDLTDVARCVASGVIRLVSPLDSRNFAEIELSFEQLDWLDWLLAGQVKRFRVEEITDPTLPPSF
jgi:hypothetical protein